MESNVPPRKNRQAGDSEVRRRERLHLFVQRKEPDRPAPPPRARFEFPILGFREPSEPASAAFMVWLKAMLRLLSTSARDFAFIALVIAVFQLAVLRQPFPDLGDLLTGLLMVLLGLALFVRGLDRGLFPPGQSMAHAFARKGSLPWLIENRAFKLGSGSPSGFPLDARVWASW